MDIATLKDDQLATLIENRWASSDTVFQIVKQVYDQNVRVYKNTPASADATASVKKRSKTRANRVFRDVESVINSIIANLPQINFVPSRDTPQSKLLAQTEQIYFLKKYKDRNVKEVMRKGLRNLYFSRLIVLKPFWNAKINDFDVRAVDPKAIRVGKNATKEEDSEFVIEEVTDNVTSVAARFPSKEKEIFEKSGYTTAESAYINNPDIKYKEAWIGDYLICKYGDLILSKGRNPYWDWDGLLVTQGEKDQVSQLGGDQKKAAMLNIRMQQSARQGAVAALAAKQKDQNAEDVGGPETDTYSESPAEDQMDATQLQAYYFNHFDHPRKPYIFTTILNNENTPIGQTDFISQATPLQEGIDRRKQDIDENASLVNGQIKVDSSVMSKADAQKLRYEARGVIWGKGVKDGVTREMGTALPNFVYEDMVDSRNEIDNIMGATAAFRGERQGQETKAGRLALIDQSYNALNELVQVVDYCSYELFNWFFQLAKVRYTEHHYAKEIGKDGALQIMAIMQDDFEDGTEVRVIAGKTLPEDREFRYAQAQEDVKAGIISPITYLEITGYPNPQSTVKEAFMYKVDPWSALAITDEERQKIPPPLPNSTMREDIKFSDLPAAAKVQWLGRMGIQIQPTDIPPGEGVMPSTIAFKDLPPDGQIQLAAKAGIVLDPKILLAEKMAENKAAKDAADAKANPLGLIKSPIQQKP
jgi:hypothetical protein